MTRTIATSTHPPIGSRAIYDDMGYIYNKVWYNIDLFYQENINYNYTIVNLSHSSLSAWPRGGNALSFL